MEGVVGAGLSEGFERLVNAALLIAAVLLAVVLVVLLVRYCWKRKRMKLKQQDASGKLKS